jgi:hypothetical protein
MHQRTIADSISGKRAQPTFVVVINFYSTNKRLICFADSPSKSTIAFQFGLVDGRIASIMKKASSTASTGSTRE